MRRFILLSLVVLLAGCAGKAVRAPRTEATPVAQLRTSLSIREPAATGQVHVASDGPRIREQMELARALSERADRRFLAEVKDRVPFSVDKAPWLDRPVIELSLEEVRIEPAPEGSAEPGKVKVEVRLVADLPEAGVAIDRELVYERALPAPVDAETLETSLGPAVEEAAALAASWLVEATTPAAARPSE